MPTKPWLSVHEPEPDREYLALLSYLPLNRYRMIPQFLRYSSEVRAQLKESDGLVGYSLLAQLFRRRFWTLSVWRDEQALMDFVRKLPHRKVMGDLQGHMGKTEFARWKISSSSIPSSWKEALKRITPE